MEMNFPSKIEKLLPEVLFLLILVHPGRFKRYSVNKVVGDLSSHLTSPQAEFTFSISDLHPTKELLHKPTFLLVHIDK